ncbi:MAG: response regulator [Gammaproteobacteria bacterium]|nr:response regulator [Gammaproteobacteria bacterium]
MGLRVLVVEDNLNNQTVVQEMLGTLDCHPVLCGDGRSALELLDRERFDLVLMDCQMPVMDGYEATRQLRERERRTGLARLPVIALTAYALKGDRERALAVGMDDYLSKPFTLNGLREILERWHATT